MFNETIYRDEMKRQHGTTPTDDEIDNLRLLFAQPVTPMVSAVRWAMVSGILAGVAFTLIALTLMGRMSWH